MFTNNDFSGMRCHKNRQKTVLKLVFDIVNKKMCFIISNQFNTFDPRLKLDYF